MRQSTDQRVRCPPTNSVPSHHTHFLRSSSGDAPLSAGSFGGFPGFSGSIRHKKRHGLFMFAGTVACSAALSSSAASAEAAEPAKGAKGGLPQGLGGMRLVSGSCMMPRPDKVKTGGEDAFFIAPDGTAVGVADGVGGWGDVGVDPAQHSRLLMANCRSYCEALANDIRLEEAGTAQPPMEVPRPADGEAADGAAAEPQARPGRPAARPLAPALCRLSCVQAAAAAARLPQGAHLTTPTPLYPAPSRPHKQTLSAKKDVSPRARRPRERQRAHAGHGLLHRVLRLPPRRDAPRVQPG